MSGLVKHLRDLNDQAGRYVAQRGNEKLRECEDAIADLQGKMQTVQKSISAVEAESAKIEKDLNESKATERNIHDNLRHRHLQAEVQRIQAEHDGLNLDEASEASKTWDAKYNNSKKKENELNGEVSVCAIERRRHAHVRNCPGGTSRRRDQLAALADHRARAGAQGGLQERREALHGEAHCV